MTTADHTTPERPTYGRLLRTPGVAALYATSLANILGSSLQIITLSVVVYAATGSALWSSAAFAAGFLPQLVGGALLTSLADRWPARRVLVAGALVRAGVVGVLALASPPPAVAIALVAAAAVVQPVPSAAQAALVARLVSGELYVLGRSVSNLISSGAQLAGLATGGAVVTTLGPGAAFGVAAAVQVAGLLAVAGLPRLPVVPAAGRWRPDETWRGNLELLRHRAVRRILLSWWLPSMLLVGAESLVVAYVGEGGAPAAATGLLLAAFPGGAVVGDVLVGRWLPPRWRTRSVPWLLALVGAGLLPLAFHPPVAVAVATLAAASAGTAYQLGGQRAFLAAVPEHRQGLAFGLFGTGMMGLQGIGPVAAGAVADGVGAGVTITALGGLVLVLTVVLGRVPSAAPPPTAPTRVDQGAPVTDSYWAATEAP